MHPVELNIKCSLNIHTQDLCQVRKRLVLTDDVITATLRKIVSDKQRSL